MKELIVGTRVLRLVFEKRDHVSANGIFRSVGANSERGGWPSNSNTGQIGGP